MFAVLLLRALVPAGFMPGSDGWLQLCSRDGARWMLDADAAASSHDRCFRDQALSSAVLPEAVATVFEAPFAPILRAAASSSAVTANHALWPPARASPPFS